jgi:hypothetical protein
VSESTGALSRSISRSAAVGLGNLRLTTLQHKIETAAAILQLALRRTEDIVRSRNVMLMSLGLLTICGMLTSTTPQSSRDAESQVYTAESVGHNCTSDLCASTGEGCATCVELKITLPLNAWITKTHCDTNASYPIDYPRHELHEVNCGTDVSWSVFDTPIVSKISNAVTIRTVYHNRSSDRSRDVRLRVEWYEIAKPVSDGGK